MQFHEKLFDLRKKAGMTQSDLAERLNVSRQAVSRWEMGTAMPEIDNLIAMSDLFGVTLDELLRDRAPQVPEAVQKVEEKPEPQGSAGVLVIVPPVLGCSLLVYGWLFDKRILNVLGLGLLGLSAAALVIGLIVFAVYRFTRKLRK